MALHRLLCQVLCCVACFLVQVFHLLEVLVLDHFLLEKTKFVGKIRLRHRFHGKNRLVLSGLRITIFRRIRVIINL